MEKPTLYYIHDPMCSWCWGFNAVWQEVQKQLIDQVNIQYLLGGLAVDNNETMSEAMQHSIRSNWQRIQKEIPGTVFNYDFWTLCQPRRSTYPACRAIIACRMQRPELEKDLLYAIQQAYYLQAKNPSNIDTLTHLAIETGLNGDRFNRDIKSEKCQNILLEEIKLCRNLNINSFPSLVLKQEKSYTLLDLDYNNSKIIVNQII